MGTRSHTKIGWRTGVLAFVLLGLLSVQAQPKPKPPGQRGVVDATSQPLAAKAPAQYYALVIGINDYKKVHKLQTPIADATEIERILKKYYGFRTTLLKDATRDQIRTSLNWYRRNLSPNSNLLIYYAGHGILDSGEAYWVPVDGSADDNIEWISADDITTAVRSIPAKHVLVISDSCYSGAIIADDGTTRSLGRVMTPRDQVAYLARLDGAKSRNWMASGTKEPVADDGAPGHSIFAAALIQGLTQTKEDQFGAGDLFWGYVRRRVAGHSTQLPQYGLIRNSGDDMGDFIFSRGGAAPPDQGDVPPDLDTHDLQGRTDPVIPTDLFDAQAEQQKIKAVLDQYELGRKRKDASILWKVWPGAPVETKLSIESYFRNAASVSTQLEMLPAEIASDHVTATAMGQMHEQYRPRNGDAPPMLNADITFTLKKNNDVWTIVDVKTKVLR